MRKGRKSDTGTAAATPRRSDRLFQVAGQWYFQTREEGAKGPFPDRSTAQEMAEAYVRSMGSPFRPSSGLSLVPLGE